MRWLKFMPHPLAVGGVSEENFCLLFHSFVTPHTHINFIIARLYFCRILLHDDCGLLLLLRGVILSVAVRQSTWTGVFTLLFCSESSALASLHIFRKSKQTSDDSKQKEPRRKEEREEKRKSHLSANRISQRIVKRYYMFLLLNAFLM
jgi:hypothetical protein